MGFFLGPEAVAELREMARRVLRDEVGSLMRRQRTDIPSGPRLHVMKTDSTGVGTLSTDTPGSGTGTIYYLSTGGTLVQKSTISQTIYNMTTAGVPGSKYVQVKQDLEGTLWVDVAPCT